jgi:broad specificity phosphatase PhoE
MSWPRTLALVRHAESQGNILTVEERARYEVSTHAYALTARGRDQARLTGEYLRTTFGAFDVYYTSYYARAKETMAIMYPEARVYEDDRLAEAQRGIWQTYTRAEIAKSFPAEVARKGKEGLYHHRPLGGENWPDIGLRAHSFLSTLSRDCAGQKVLIVVHGHWLILFQKLIHHFSIEEALRRYEQAVAPNASVTVYDGIETGGKSRLVLSQEHFVPWQGLLP